jgi:hypothetical protein
MRIINFIGKKRVGAGPLIQTLICVRRSVGSVGLLNLRVPYLLLHLLPRSGGDPS